jgi:hypothetical protein
VNVSSARIPDFSVIPPFFYSGALIQGADSGLWYPPGEIIINSVWASARVAGTSGSIIVVQAGDETFQPDGFNLTTLTIPNASKRVGVNLSATGTTPLKVNTSQWIRVICFTSGGHEDVTIQINAEYV